MSNLHPTIAAALAPFAPVSRPRQPAYPGPVNDDDVYIVDPVAGRIISRMGSRVDYPMNTAVTLPLGTCAMYGMQAKHFNKGA